MNKKDNFDKLLIGKFQETKPYTEDNGFAERVLASLPAKKSFRLNRSLIFYSIEVLSLLIFLLSGGIKTLISSIADVYNNTSHLLKPSLISVFIVLVFICIPFFTARIEYNENPISE